MSRKSNPARIQRGHGRGVGFFVDILVGVSYVGSHGSLVQHSQLLIRVLDIAVSHASFGEVLAHPLLVNVVVL
jgi:hypothetical protein